MQCKDVHLLQEIIKFMTSAKKLKMSSDEIYRSGISIEMIYFTQ